MAAVATKKATPTKPTGAIFLTLARGWVPHLEWPAKDLKEAAQLLLKISLANGGAIFMDWPLRLSYMQDYSQNRARHALDRKARLYAKQLGGAADISRQRTPISSPSAPLLPYVQSQTWVPSIVSRDPGESISAIEFFKANPTFSNYVQLLFQAKVSPVPGVKPASTLFQQIILELKAILKETVSLPHYSVRNINGKRASSIFKDLSIAKEAQTISEKSVSSAAHAVLLRSRSYLPFITNLVAGAQSRINIIMFFFKFEDEKKYPTDDLVDKIVAAKKRGVDVKIILDKDAENDPAGSRLVNAAVFEKFQKCKIPVAFDSGEVMTHSKILIVDDAHVVVGSHNWTSGSFYAYDDTSVYVESVDLARKYSAIFDDSWRKCIQG